MPVIRDQSDSIVNVLDEPITDSVLATFFDGTNNEFWAVDVVTFGSVVNAETINSTFGFYLDDEGNRIEPFALGEAHLQQVGDLLNKLSRYIDLNFAQAGEDEPPLINIAFTDAEFGGSGTASYPQYRVDNINGEIVEYGASVQLATLSPDTDTDFSDFYLNQIVMHELGHALGLAHPFEIVNNEFVDKLPEDIRGADYTIMNYTVQSSRYPGYVLNHYPDNWLLLDIMALQAIYGVDQTVTVGDDTYTYVAGQTYYENLWDTAGNDTIKIVGNVSTNIDLSKAGWIDVGSSITYRPFDNVGDHITETATVYLMDGVVIENVTGGGGSDWLVGNDVSNRLIASTGNDTLDGGAGDDFLRGDAGDDRVIGGTGDDTIFAGPGDEGDDVVEGGAGSDLLAGGAGDDLVVGGVKSTTAQQVSASSDSDTLFGGAGNDTLVSGGWIDADSDDRFDAGEESLTTNSANTAYGGAGDDVVYGAAGNDILGGGAGGDTLNGGAGDDVFYGGKGATDNDDVFDAGAGDDTVFGGSGSDVLNGFAGADQLFGGSGNDTIDGGGDADSLFGASGNDVLTGGGGADAFFFGGSHGDDVVTDFDAAADTLFLGNTVTDFTDLASVQAAATATTQNGQSGLLIDTGGGNSVFLVGVASSDLTSESLSL